MKLSWDCEIRFEEVFQQNTNKEYEYEYKHEYEYEYEFWLSSMVKPRKYDIFVCISYIE